MRDYRRPFGFVSKEIPEESQSYKIQYRTYGKLTGSYAFKSSDSNLLIDIDNNNAVGVADALEKEKIDVNDLYVIPSWEIPEADEPQFQTFLHRALWQNSADVFKLLLQKGANPKIKGHCNSTVIDDLFYSHTAEDILKFGKMLVDAGVKTEEIKKRAKALEKIKKYKPYVQKLIHYANTKKVAISHTKGRKSSVKVLEHIKD